MKRKTTDFDTLVYQFLEKLEGFQYQLSGYDHLWDILFPAVENH